MKIVIASGKGGVGKSMVTSSLALLLSKTKKIVACDCDVDAPNLGLWLGIKDYDKKQKISTSFKAEINQKKCTKCGKCFEVCKFKAITRNDLFSINPFLCEGCGACEIVCPEKAIKLKKVKNAEIRIKKTEYGFPLISAQLYPGESGSGKIVEELRKKTEEFDYEIMLLDAPAGIGCPVIASVRECDFAVLVTEPTPSGFSDLKRILEIVNYFKITYGIVINKWTINQKLSKKIQDWSKEKFLGKIPYDKKVIEAIVNLRPIIYYDKKIESLFLEILNEIKKRL